MKVNFTLGFASVLLVVLLFMLLFIEPRSGGGTVSSDVDADGVIGRSCVVDYENPRNAASCLLGSEFMEY